MLTYNANSLANASHRLPYRRKPPPTGAGDNLAGPALFAPTRSREFSATPFVPVHSPAETFERGLVGRPGDEPWKVG